MKAKKRVLALIILLVVVVTVHAQRIKNSSRYFHTPSKVGLVIIPQIGYYGRNGASGLGLVGGLISATTKPSGGKYQAALDAVEPIINPELKVQEFYKELLSGFGKSVTVITDKIDFATLADFKGVKEKGKKYFEKDVSVLKEKYQVDELLIVNVYYGVRSIYSYGVVEQNRRGVMLLQTDIISLQDNSIVVNDGSAYWAKIDGKWDTPPNYENLKKSIQSAVDSGLATEKSKYK